MSGLRSMMPSLCRPTVSVCLLSSPQGSIKYLDCARGSPRKYCFRARYEPGPGEPSRCVPVGACSGWRTWRRVKRRLLLSLAPADRQDPWREKKSHRVLRTLRGGGLRRFAPLTVSVTRRIDVSSGEENLLSKDHSECNSCWKTLEQAMPKICRNRSSTCGGRGSTMMGMRRGCKCSRDS